MSPPFSLTRLVSMLNVCINLIRVGGDVVLIMPPWGSRILASSKAAASTLLL